MDKEDNNKEIGELDVEFEELDEEGEQAVKKNVKKAKDALSSCQKERQEYLEGWQRARADLVNERAQHEKDRQRISEAARLSLIEDLLPVLDHFDMAFANKEAWEKVDTAWRAGVEMIYNNFLSILAQHGITPYAPLGEAFDPAAHESLEMIPTEKQSEDQKVVAVLQKGYRSAAMVIRPAKVKVAVYKKKS